MDLQQIKYFLAVVDSGTFLAAAHNVHVSQPTLSAGIRKLEESLDVTLFNRGSRAATLTTAGKQFLEPARQAFNQLHSIKSRLREDPHKIVIGVLTNIHMDHVASIIRAHRASHPHVLIELVVADSQALKDMLQQQTVDLIIANSSTGVSNFTPLFAEELCLVVPRDHRLAQEKSVDLNVLSDELFIERVNCSFWQDVNRVFTEQQISPHTVMQSDSDEFVLSLVAANLGVSVITNRRTPYPVAFIPLKEIGIHRSIGVAITDTAPSDHVATFYQTLLNQYKNYQPRKQN
ncbi:LysR family transcriptional regulator [Aliamphritea spongicola]|uniref:LysR family transcriptional regulator n=1 Tax=Aliamphritea spongicola TaxID=707589 RepID=UPI00196B3B72|nr:LysR family transcriptional regulator [Aliamphritea spongicola]MBN3560776.1 LysR family transcriptional regulator [Aliamphritea spongicola]